MSQERQTVPGWLKSPEVAAILGLTESQFRRRHKEISSIQLHKNGPRLFKETDVLNYAENINREE